MRWFPQFLKTFAVLADTNELSGIVLSRDPAGERFLRIRIFDQVLGLKAALFSLPGKSTQKSIPPDLFDDVNCLLNPNHTQLSIPFVTDFQRVFSYRALAIDPLIFLTASQIAGFILSMETTFLNQLPFKIVVHRLIHFSGHRFPSCSAEAVVLFCEDEGLPVRESWLAGLPRRLSLHAQEVLGLPVDRAMIELR